MSQRCQLPLRVVQHYCMSMTSSVVLADLVDIFIYSIVYTKLIVIFCEFVVLWSQIYQNTFICSYDIVAESPQDVPVMTVVPIDSQGKLHTMYIVKVSLSPPCVCHRFSFHFYTKALFFLTLSKLYFHTTMSHRAAVSDHTVSWFAYSTAQVLLYQTTPLQRV